MSLASILQQDLRASDQQMLSGSGNGQYGDLSAFLSQDQYNAIIAAGGGSSKGWNSIAGSPAGYSLNYNPGTTYTTSNDGQVTDSNGNLMSWDNLPFGQTLQDMSTQGSGSKTIGNGYDLTYANNLSGRQTAQTQAAQHPDMTNEWLAAAFTAAVGGAAAMGYLGAGAGATAGAAEGAATSAGAFGSGSMEAVDAVQLAGQGIGQGQLASTLSSTYNMGFFGSNAMAAGAEMGMGSSTLSGLQSLASGYNTVNKGMNAVNALSGGQQQTGGNMDWGSVLGSALASGNGSTAGMADPFASQRPQYQQQLQQMMQGGFSPQDPSYDWRFQQGQNAVNASSAAGHQLNSGNRGVELTQYGQGMASTEYQNQFSRLSSLAGVGSGSPQAAASQQSSYNQNQAQGYGQLGQMAIQGFSSLLGGGSSSSGGGLLSSLSGLFSGGGSTASDSSWGSLIGGGLG